MIPSTGEMPKKVYTVGDTIRLELSLISTSNIEDVHAFYARDETTALRGTERVHDVPKPHISFEGTIEDTSIYEPVPYRLPKKRHTTSLSCIVDRDHVPGSYHLDRLILRNASGDTMDTAYMGALNVDAESFRIEADGIDVSSIEISLVDEPEYEGSYAE
jgi:hypothetical protein